MNITDNQLAKERFEFTEDVMRIVLQLCKVIFNIKNEKEMSSRLLVNKEQLREIIEKIVAALPNQIFNKKNKARREEIKNICAREFIFFQAQERGDDPHYEADLEHYIYAFSKDMRRRIEQED